eukprot:COSAG05_NODE_9574_length_615_cov_0.794574_1_plen_36_part_01
MVDVVNKRCEDCQKKRPNFGMVRLCHLQLLTRPPPP